MKSRLFRIEGKKWDIVVVDINNSDTESDLWVPTKDFLDEEFLKKCHKILDSSIGKLIGFNRSILNCPKRNQLNVIFFSKVSLL